MQAPEHLRKVKDLAKLLRDKRKAGRLTLEQVARITGVSASTLSRFERLGTGSGMSQFIPDTRTLATVVRWLDIPTERLIDEEELSVSNHTPDIVEAHLRADRNLSEEAAKMLGAMFRSVYEQFAESNSVPSPQETDNLEQK